MSTNTPAVKPNPYAPLSEEAKAALERTAKFGSVDDLRKVITSFADNPEATAILTKGAAQAVEKDNYSAQQMRVRKQAVIDEAIINRPENKTPVGLQDTLAEIRAEMSRLTERVAVLETAATKRKGPAV